MISLKTVEKFKQIHIYLKIYSIDVQMMFLIKVYCYRPGGLRDKHADTHTDGRQHESHPFSSHHEPFAQWS